jgi:aquaporin Z
MWSQILTFSEAEVEKTSQAFMAELFGTMVLVLGGCGAVIFGGPTLSNLAISLGFGLTVITMAYTIGHISGCHLNPAISLAMFLSNKIDASRLIQYIVAQFIGAAVGGAILLVMCHFHVQDFNIDELHSFSFASNGYGVHSPGHYGLASCFICEVILTALFAWVVLGTTRASFPAGFGGLVAGLALVMVHLVGIHITGTSVNPARSFGVAVYKGGDALSQLWLFIVAPLMGAILSTFLYKLTSQK